ncbi:MAG: hypothetical protein WBF06_06640 [Candidatus Acidiferrales bacterium]
MVPSGFLLYGLSYALRSRLYDPGRCPYFGLLLFHLVFIPPVCVGIWIKIREPIAASKSALRFSEMRSDPKTLIAIGVFAVVAATGLAVHRYDVKGGGTTGDVPDSVYRYLNTLPMNTCAAGRPTDVNFVPLTSRRCVPLALDALNVRLSDFRGQIFNQLGDILGLVYAGNVSRIRAGARPTEVENISCESGSTYERLPC